MFRQLLRKCIWVFMFVLTAMQTMEAIDTDGDLANGVNFEASLTKTEFNFDGNVVDISQYISANARFEIIDLDPAVCPGNYQIQVKLSPDEENYIGEVVTLYYDIIGKVPAPVVETQTCTSITLEAFDNCIYGIDGGNNWSAQTSPTFRNLETGKTYTIAQAINGCQSENVEITLDHDYDEGVVSKEPTCTEKGEKTYTCKRNLSHKKVEEIPAKGHELEVVETEPATCTEDGHKAIVKCKVCGELIIAGEVIPALGHDLVHVETKPATCTEDGNVEYYYCKREPGKFYTDEALTIEIPEAELKTGATGHEWFTDTETPGACGAHQCSVCHASDLHDFDDNYVCKVCKYKHVHEWNDDNAEAYHQCQADFCEYHRSELSHEFEGGVCKVCGYEHRHNWSRESEVHRCLASGCPDAENAGFPHTFVDGKCTVCGLVDLDGCNIVLSQKVFEYDGNPHKPSVTVYNRKGEEMTEGVHYFFDWDNPESFAFGDDFTAPGIHTYCIYAYPSLLVQHRFTWIISSENCTQETGHEWLPHNNYGGEYHACQHCGTVKEHNWKYVDGNRHICDDCGREAEHTFDEDDLCTACGVHNHDWQDYGDPFEHYCSLDHKEDHTFENGVCTVCGYEHYHDWIRTSDMHKCTSPGCDWYNRSEDHIFGADGKCTVCGMFRFENAEVTVSSPLRYQFTGDMLFPDLSEITVTLNGVKLKRDVDYEIQREERADIGLHQIQIYPIPDYYLDEDNSDPCVKYLDWVIYDDDCAHEWEVAEKDGFHHCNICATTDFHTPEEVKAKEPTCTEPGHTAGYKCKECGAVIEGCEEIRAHGHLKIKFEAVEATCTKPGHYEYYICAYEPDVKYKYVDGEEIFGEDEHIIPTVEHDFTKQIVSEDTRWSEATCESSAVYYYSCSHCHEADTDETNTFEFCEPLGHDLKLVENAVEATCTEKGKSAKYECTREGCEHTEGGEEIKALGHEFLSYKFNNDATCIADGTETAKCTRCDVTDTRYAEGTAHGHVTIKFDAVPATCTNPGNKEYYICAYEPDEKYKDAAGIEMYTDEDPYIIPTVPHLFTIHSDADEKGLHNLLCEYGCNTAKANTKVIENALGEGNDIELNEEGGKLVYKGDLALGDRGEFFSPVDFTVLGNVSFDRIASKDTMTLILPYDVPAEDVAGQVYTLSYFDGKALRYEEADGIKANVPCMIRLSDGQSSLNSTLVKGQSDVTLRSTTTIDTVVANGGKAIQFGAYKETVYQSGDNSQEYDYYGYKNGKFVKARLDISVSPFRSAVRLTKASGLRSLNFDYNLDELPIIFGGEATNVEEVDATAEFGGKVNVYDALGRAIRLDVDAEGALDGLNDGLYMVNGKRVYVKNQR